MVRSARAYVASFGTAGTLVAGASVLFVIASAVVSFRGWPAVTDHASGALVTLPANPASAVSPATSGRRLAAAIASTTRATGSAGAGGPGAARTAAARKAGTGRGSLNSAQPGANGNNNGPTQTGATPAGARGCATCTIQTPAASYAATSSSPAGVGAVVNATGPAATIVSGAAQTVTTTAKSLSGATSKAITQANQTAATVTQGAGAVIKKLPGAGSAVSRAGNALSSAGQTVGNLTHGVLAPRGAGSAR